MSRTAKKILSILLLGTLVLVSSACSVKKSESYDISGYIRGVMKCGYLGDNADYVASGITEANAAEYHNTTVYNAAIRFFTKYNIDVSDNQLSAMQEVMASAYANSKFTVGNETEASYGYDVVVTYSVQTTFVDIEDEILKKVEALTAAGDSEKDRAVVINGIIDLCKNTVEQATSYGSVETVTFDIQKDSMGNLSLNTKLFSQIDTAILPF